MIVIETTYYSLAQRYSFLRERYSLLNPNYIIDMIQKYHMIIKFPYMGPIVKVVCHYALCATSGATSPLNPTHKQIILTFHTYTRNVNLCNASQSPCF